MNNSDSGGGQKTQSLDVEALYEKYGPMVFRRCKFLLRNEEKALDALQDVFLRLLERKHKLSSVCCSYLYQAATTVSLNHIRSDRLRDGTGLDERVLRIAEYRGGNHEERTINTLTLDRLFEGTRSQTRYIAVLHYIDGLTLEETAREVKMSVSGVRKRLAGLRKKMISGEFA